MKRNKHSLSHYVLSTFDMGWLVPVCNFEVLPGDSIRMSTSCLLRVSPLMAPVMHPIQVRLHHWFCPYRILWNQWEDFITGGPDGDSPATMPVFPAAANGNPHTLGSYLGVPANADAALTVSALPFRAYNKIWNEFYRDQDLQPELDTDLGTAIQGVSWEKDRFTSARPWTQKGPDVTIPLGTTAPILGLGRLAAAAGNPVAGQSTRYSGGTTSTPPFQVGGGDIAANWAMDVTTGVGATAFPNIRADLSGVSSPSVNDFRLAFALQRYQEARAQYGSRYTEYLRYLGVTSSDARLQRPEYLGGGKSTISFSEVLKTGEGDTPSDDSPIGEMRGHGISAMRSRRWVRFFEEHGVVLTLASIRPRSIYTDGLHKSFLRRSKEDYWQRELEQIGQEEISNSEVYAPGADPSGVFGYQDRYSDYRHLPSYVTGEFRTTMNDWHLARSFASAPALNASFVECEPSKRIHAEQTTDTIWGMFSHSIQARRMVGHKTIGRIF